MTDVEKQKVISAALDLFMKGQITHDDYIKRITFDEKKPEKKPAKE
jgi:hypothetical protein